MTEPDKRIRELREKLHSENSRTVSSAILSLRNEDPFNGAAGQLIELFDRTDDVFIKNLVRNFLNDLKGLSVRAEIVAELSRQHKPDTLAMVASSCWQSGLDYSEYAMDFSREFVQSDYLVALECFTVIEESVPQIPDQTRNDMMIFLSEWREKLPSEKNKLLEALLLLIG
jgi:hypothetical protein